MFGVGMILSGTLALMPSMMQDLMNYPVFTSGWMMAPRGIGTMIAMFIVGRTINKIDNRAVHPHRVPADRGLAVADDRLFAATWGPGRSSSPALPRALASALLLYR